MLERDIVEWGKGVSKITSMIANKGYFLCLLGSIFLLGIVSKWIVMWNLKRMIKKADHMDSPQNNTLRQIKLKFESIKTVNGTVANPMLLVRRYINRCKWGTFYLASLNKITIWCAFVCVGVGGIAGYILYSQGYGKTTAMSYILVSFYFTLALFVVEQSVRTGEREMELIYIITDFFENSVNLREQVKMKERSYDLSLDEEESLEEKNEEQQDSYQGKIDITKEQERIINEVLGEYLQ